MDDSPVAEHLEILGRFARVCFSVIQSRSETDAFNGFLINSVY